MLFMANFRDEIPGFDTDDGESPPQHQLTSSRCSNQRLCTAVIMRLETKAHEVGLMDLLHMRTAVGKHHVARQELIPPKSTVDHSNPVIGLSQRRFILVSYDVSHEQR